MQAVFLFKSNVKKSPNKFLIYRTFPIVIVFLYDLNVLKKVKIVPM